MWKDGKLRLDVAQAPPSPSCVPGGGHGPPPIGIWVAASPRHGPSPQIHQGWVGQSLSSGLAKEQTLRQSCPTMGALSPHPGSVNTEEHQSVLLWVPCRFYEKVQALHQDPEASVDNPLLAFSLIKCLHSDWPNIIYKDEATRNTQGTGKMLSFVSPLLPRPGNRWRGWGTGGEARKLLEERNGWRSRMWDPQGNELIGAIAPHNFINFTSFPPCSTPCWP